MPTIMTVRNCPGPAFGAKRIAEIKLVVIAAETPSQGVHPPDSSSHTGPSLEEGVLPGPADPILGKAGWAKTMEYNAQPSPLYSLRAAPLVGEYESWTSELIHYVF